MNQIHNRRNVVAALLGGTALVWLATRSKQPDPQPADVPQLSLDSAKEWIAAGAIVLDVRGDEQCKFRHIPVAVLLPVEALRLSIPAWLTAAKEKQIVVYCGDGVAHGPEATRLLVQAGFGKAANLTVGVEGWEKAGLPLARG